jgi:hypothetical protein
MMGTARKETMRPSHEPTEKTREQAWFMAAIGVQQPHISMTLGIGEHTLRKYYRRELDLGMVEADANGLYQKAISNRPDAVTAAIFWLKTRCGWRDIAPQDSVPALPPPPIYIEFMGPGEKDANS